MPGRNLLPSYCTDIAIIGAGPAGLCFARALAGSGLSVTVLEKQARSALESPAFDGREIALTHTSRAQLQELDIWPRLPPEEISLLRDAKVMNGPSLFALTITARDGKASQLGWLVPNHLIRKAAFEAVVECGNVELCTGVSVNAIQRTRDCMQVQLDDGRELRARLVVAADSRFSQTRRMLGIGTRMRDFGKTMLVCRVRHERPHGHEAWEWFGHGQTLALLPLNGQCASVVLTLPQQDIETLLSLDDTALARDFERRFDGRLGAMEVISSRHPYPLIGVYADRFVSHRYALLGDAAVGMHPVTAHGFNLGLLGQARLAREILTAVRQNQDFASAQVLARYQRRHRLASWPLYQATLLIAGLYTDNRIPARLARDALLHMVQRIPPFRQMIAAQLTHATASCVDSNRAQYKL